jgi:pilus assembly protein CpaB
MIALLGSLVISGGCTLMLGRHLTAHAAKSEPRVQYVVVAAPITAGDTVKAEQVRLMDWPAAQPITGAIQKTQDVIGRPAMYPMDKGEIVLDKYLASPGSSLGLTTKIPDGMRAIALKSDEVMGVAGFLFPGSHVDVLVTYRPPQSSDPVTSTVMQDAQVLAVGQQVQPDPNGKPVAVDVLTILANAADAQKVVLASTQGTLHFVLRNGGDKAQSDDAPVQLSALGAAPTVNAQTRATGKSSAKPKPYVVQTILGDKQGSVSFSQVESK